MFQACTYFVSFSPVQRGRNLPPKKGRQLGSKDLALFRSCPGSADCLAKLLLARGYRFRRIRWFRRFSGDLLSEVEILSRPLLKVCCQLRILAGPKRRLCQARDNEHVDSEQGRYCI